MTGSPPIASDAHLTLVTLGASELRATFPDARAPRVLLGPGKPLALLAYLALCPGRTASREHLFDLLWADREPERWRSRLRQTLWQIKQDVGTDVVEAQGQLLVLHPRVRVDCDDFVASAAGRRFAEAVACYSGEFLPRLESSTTIEFAHWAEGERSRLRAMYVRCAEHLARQALASGEHREALEWAKRVHDADRQSESAWRLLLESLVAAGESAECAATVSRLESFLAGEGREPEAATVAILRAAKRLPKRKEDSDSRLLVPDLVGRAKEFALLLEEWQAARRGSARHLRLVGAAGMGKSRLLSDFRERGRALPGRVVLVRANPGDREIPYSLLGEVARALAEMPGAAGVDPGCAAALVALNPALATTYAVQPSASHGSELLRHRAIAMHALIAAIADEAPLALLIDDFHWADDASRLALSAALGRFTSSRVLVVTASRTTEQYLTSTGVEAPSIALEPLSERDTAGLVSSLACVTTGSPVSRLAATVHAVSGGSPLLAIESLQLLIDRKALSIHDGSWVLHDVAALETLLASGGAVRSRIERLEPAARQAILLLSVAGSPVPERMITRLVDMSEMDFRDGLIELERRGLASRGRETWRPAHDEIAMAAIDTADRDDVADANRRLARAYLDQAGGDAELLLRAGRHAAVAVTAEIELRRAFVEWVRSIRRARDPRSTRQLANDFIGRAVDPATRRMLVSSIPLHLHGWRAATVASAAVVTMALLVVAVARAVPARARELPPDVELIASARSSSGATSSWRLELRLADLEYRRAFDLPSHGRATDMRELPIPGELGRQIAVAPNGAKWVYSRTVADSGGDELLFGTSENVSRRLTFSPGDDLSPSWSPDGRWIVFSTARFDSTGRLDLAILDPASGRVRQLTSGPEADSYARWSPSGERIAFLRRHFEDRRHQVCTLAPDADELSCSDIQADGAATVAGWSTPEEIVLSLHSNGATRLVGMRDREWTTRVLDLRREAEYQLSPDGRWALCLCSSAPTAPRRWIVFPVERPELSREITAGNATGMDLELYWLRSQSPTLHVDTLWIEKPDSTIAIGAGFRMRVRGRRVDGQPVDVGSVRWSTDDTSKAEITADGVLLPKRAGRVTVVANHSGWRSAQLMLDVRGSTSWSPLFRLDWRTSHDSVLRHYGTPLPAVAYDGRLGRALWNSGDGEYFSGSYSRESHGAGAGLGIEAWISTPLSRPTWQLQRIELSSVTDSDLRAWDHATGYMPRTQQSMLNSCLAGYPGGEGETALERLELIAGTSPLPGVPVEKGMRSGTPFLLRIQLLPDGRCAFALNRRPVAISSTAIDSRLRLRFVMYGNSVDTRVLLGAVETWRGVRDDIDWSALDRPRGTPQ